MNLTGCWLKALVPAAVVGLLAILFVAATDFKNVDRGILVFGSEALAAGLLVGICIKLSRYDWSWAKSSCVVFTVFLLLIMVVPVLFFPR
jgi:hypothetical protein